MKIIVEEIEYYYKSFRRAFEDNEEPGVEVPDHLIELYHEKQAEANLLLSDIIIHYEMGKAYEEESRDS